MGWPYFLLLLPCLRSTNDEKKYSRWILLKPRHLIFLFLIAMICGWLPAAIPSLYLSSFNPVLVFKGLKLKTGSATLIRGTGGSPIHRVCNIYHQYALFVYMQIQHVKDRKLGFKEG